MSGEDLSFCMSQWPVVKPRQAAPSLSREGTINLNRQLATKRMLLKSFRPLMATLLKLLSDNQPKFRSTVRVVCTHAFAHTLLHFCCR